MVNYISPQEYEMMVNKLFAGNSFHHTVNDKRSSVFIMSADVTKTYLQRHEGIPVSNKRVRWVGLEGELQGGIYCDKNWQKIH